MLIKVAIALIGLCFVVSAQDMCRKYTCDGAELLPGNVCMSYNETRDVYVLSPCDSTITTCPNPRTWGTASAITCTEWVTRKVFSSDTFEDYYDSVLLLNLGDLCDEQEFQNICDYNNGLVCGCAPANCTCVTGTAEGGNCTATTPPCLPGYVCSNNICVLMYSVPAGETATDERACVGGGPLIDSYFSTTCRSPSETMGGFPRACTHDRDCLGTDNTYSHCICGLNDEGQAFCDLHFNDDPMVQYRNAFSNYVYKDSVYWFFIMHNYPFIQGTVPNCLRNVWREFGEYKRALTGGKHLVLSALLLSVGY